MFPTLKADVVAEVASVGASPATTNTRALIAGATENAVMAIATIATVAAMPLRATNANAARTRLRVARPA
jgi:hypothetical protein